MKVTLKRIRFQREGKAIVRAARGGGDGGDGCEYVPDAAYR